MLQKGELAPIFTLPNQSKELISLHDYKGKKNVILYFYPKDDTPGCTIEANQFSALLDEFHQHETLVWGISKDDCLSHLAFIEKFGLTVDLLADTSREVCDAYGVWQQKNKYGVRKMGIVRSTFLIDKAGKLVYVEYGVNPEGHAALMLDRVKSLNE